MGCYVAPSAEMETETNLVKSERFTQTETLMKLNDEMLKLYHGIISQPAETKRFFCQSQGLIKCHVSFALLAHTLVVQILCASIHLTLHKIGSHQKNKTVIKIFF